MCTFLPFPVLKQRWVARQHIVCDVHRIFMQVPCFSVSEADMSHPVSETHHTHPHLSTVLAKQSEDYSRSALFWAWEPHTAVLPAFNRLACLPLVHHIRKYYEPGSWFSFLTKMYACWNYLIRDDYWEFFINFNSIYPLLLLLLRCRGLDWDGCGAFSGTVKVIISLV